MKKIFQSLGLLNVFNSKTTCNLETCKSLLLNLNQEEWRLSLPTKPKLRQYILFKNKYEINPYVKSVRNKYERSLIAKLRCGILQLNIETGRFCQTPLPNRLCTICDLNLIEDEIHFICVCPAYNDERIHFYNKISNDDPHFRHKNLECKFRLIMEKAGDQLAKYINVIWNKISLLLYD